MNETTSHEIIAPIKRANTSKAPPILIASAATVFTMSPAWTTSVTALPVVATWWPIA